MINLYLSIFSSQVADSFNNMVNPLFILLNDSESLREHLARVSQWIVMSSFSTWLLFIQETTSIETFFENIHVSIDSTFLVTQQSIASSREEISCIYRIEMFDLQIRRFAFWSRETGLAGISKALDEKARDFNGKIMRIGFYDVRLI